MELQIISIIGSSNLFDFRGKCFFFLPELGLLFLLTSVTLLFRIVGLHVLIWKKNFERYI